MKQQIKITEKKERPIIFSGDMVKAILENRKTQTRRVIKPPYKDGSGIDNITRWRQPFNLVWTQETRKGWEYWDGIGINQAINRETELQRIKCPYGKIGDRLWVRETWQDADWNAGNGETVRGYFYRAMHDDNNLLKVEKWKSPIIMPRFASRITLEITNIKVERLQDISEEDAKREGVTPNGCGKFYCTGANCNHFGQFKNKFQTLWNEINGNKYTFQSNPYVWIVEFKKI